MKILQVITSLVAAGAEKLVTDISLILIEKGHEVDILIFNDTNFFEETLQNKGVNVFSLSRNNIFNPLNIFQLIPFLSKYDIIHSHNTACQYYLSIAKAISFSKTIILTTEHCASNKRRRYPIFRILDSLMYKKYSHIISVSEDTTKNLKRHVIGSNYHITTVPNGVNVDLFLNASPIEKNNIPNTDNNDVVLVMIAAFRPQKDQQTLIKAMKLLPDNIKLWLVGDGVKRSECEALVSTLNLNNRVVFLGLRDDIPAILRSSDIIVLSSHFEGLSLSSMEGMSANKPFVASNVDGLRDIVLGAGVLFEENNEIDLAEKILKLTQNKEHYKSVSEACLARARDYDIMKTVDKYEEIYLKLLEHE